MTKVNSTLQSLVFGDRSIFISNRYLREKDGSLEKPSTKQVIKTLLKLENKGFVPSNPELLLRFSKVELKAFRYEFAQVLENSTKQGLVLRTTFFDEPFPTEYTDEEWNAVFAQYAITYNWRIEYEAYTGNNPVEILDEYINTMSRKPFNLNDHTKTKQFKVGTVLDDLVPIIEKVLQSNVVLRTQQIETLKNTPITILKYCAKGCNVKIKETLILLMNLLKNEKLEFPLLKTATDVLRFIISVHAENPIEGRFLKSDLKDHKIHIPTSSRKVLLNNLERLCHGPKGAKYLTEDMFQYDSYWKIIDKYLQFEKRKKCRAKYPGYSEAIDLLYVNDRSWTFNGRLSAAKHDLDYALVTNILSEKPGILWRNVIELLRMAEGVKAPKKVNTDTSNSINNPFQTVLMNVDKSKDYKCIQTDASSFFNGHAFKSICENQLNTKLAFQLIEQINNPANSIKQYKRIVQGITIEYDIPIPALNQVMKRKVLQVLTEAMANKLTRANNKVPSIWIDPEVKEHAIQYSGHNSTELSYSGEYMAKNSIIPLSDLVLNKGKSKGQKGTIVRLGVMWRGLEDKGPSVDIDHSATLLMKDGTTTSLYYGDPTYIVIEGKNKNKQRTLASSSGDITTCGGNTSKFSTELIDFDINGLRKHNVTDFYNTFIDYGGRTSIGKLECYVFMQILQTKTIGIKKHASTININLATTDYAIRIDPNDVDNTGSYVGLHFDLIKNQIEVLAIPVKTPSGQYSNVNTLGNKFKEVIQNRVPSLTLGYALDLAFTKNQVVSLPEDASVIISRKSASELGVDENIITVLSPTKHLEQINEFIFM